MLMEVQKYTFSINEPHFSLQILIKNRKICNFATCNEKNHRNNYESVLPFATSSARFSDVTFGRCSAGKESRLVS
jgi:hypothetical protein